LLSLALETGAEIIGSDVKTPEKRSRLKIVGSVWMFATVLSVITGVGFPRILNYVDQNDFSSPQIEVQGLYIRPNIEGRTYGFTFPLLYS